MAEWSKALVRLVARFRIILRSWVRVLTKSWTVQSSHLSWAGTLVALYNVRDCLLLYNSPKSLRLVLLVYYPSGHLW